MSPTLHHESTRVPVTALASSGALLIAAEGPFLRFYHAKSSRYVASKRVFEAQAVHGISVCAEEYDNVIKLVVWGGRLVRALRIKYIGDGIDCEPSFLCLSNVVRAPDWILDLAPRLSSLDDEDQYNDSTCAAVTAHNALLELSTQYQDGPTVSSSILTLNVAELTTSSRSILYSAHILWKSSNCILVAAGTAFGEIMYWSWSKRNQVEAVSQIHRVFLGHEGSIFDVRISKELQRGCCGTLRRVIVSCSDDRTIRIWNVSDVRVDITDAQLVDGHSESQRTRHTGFSVAATDTQADDTNCLAIGWGHTSRVWKLRFLESSPCDGALALLSAGEDATSRTWKLVVSAGKGTTLPYTLLQTDCAAHHNGRNMWSIATYHQAVGLLRVACGAADSKLTTHALLGLGQRSRGQGTTVAEYTVQDLLSMAQSSDTAGDAQQTAMVPKKAESVRSYCFLDQKSFLLATNSGKILVESFVSEKKHSLQNSLVRSTVIDQLEELAGYSTCTSVPAHGVAFVAGNKGNIYMYSKDDSTLRSIYRVMGKVGSLFVSVVRTVEGRTHFALLATLVGQKQAHLLRIDAASSSSPESIEPVIVPVSETLTGSAVTSMERVAISPDKSVLILGFRRGSIGLYSVLEDTANVRAVLFRVVEKVHGDETVTAMKWLSSANNASEGHLYSVGRDGCLAVHSINLTSNIVQLVHSLSLSIGPNIENIYLHENRLMVHGFSSKKWVLYDVESEEEIMGIETGGAHRSWAFQPRLDAQSGGTLVWTRTSSLHICSQEGSNHGVLRSGGHGREIKAVAVSPRLGASGDCLVATGAEDTDIKIFQYTDGEPVCKRTLRRHTTGIQHLQWSDDGKYLFSSAGSEEFYIWRVRTELAVVDVGVICEYVYTPESEFSDLRIMSFDVTKRDTAYLIAMVFSDSSVKTFRYDATTAAKWQPLAKGLYFTSCLTQCTFLSSTSLLTAGTDGHAVVWPTSQETNHVLKWQNPARIHQNASKTMSSLANRDGTTLVVSGGDDGALAFLLADPAVPSSSSSQEGCASPLVLVNRAHGSAITACTIIAVRSHIYVLTSGNDEWIRLWEVIIDASQEHRTRVNTGNVLHVKRLQKVKTSIADVSSMAVLDVDVVATAKIIVCGVGMEVIRLDP